MRHLLLVLSIAATWCAAPSFAQSLADPTAEIVALERKAMDGWIQGDPGPTLAISDAGITYFHVMTQTRVEGRAALEALVERFRGRSLYDRYEMIDPKVQAAGDTAVLTYILVQHNGALASRWNATQVYQRKAEGWRVIHTHWSQTAPTLAAK